MSLPTAGNVGFNLVFFKSLGIVFTKKTRIQSRPLNLAQIFRQLVEFRQGRFYFLLVALGFDSHG